MPGDNNPLPRLVARKARTGVSVLSGNAGFTFGRLRGEAKCTLGPTLPATHMSARRAAKYPAEVRRRHAQALESFHRRRTDSVLQISRKPAQRCGANSVEHDETNVLGGHSRIKRSRISCTRCISPPAASDISQTPVRLMLSRTNRTLIRAPTPLVSCAGNQHIARRARARSRHFLPLTFELARSHPTLAASSDTDPPSTPCAGNVIASPTPYAFP